ncbi:MAG: class I SAM-dependent methyltransferase [Alphaproteobacteria bacterium]|nr:class I SAM-dependent methyltransferase [Alphaproteobacteria bacterium]
MASLQRIWQKNFSRRPLISFNTLKSRYNRLKYGDRDRLFAEAQQRRDEFAEKYALEQTGERQIGTIDLIEKGHVDRYEKAAELVAKHQESPVLSLLDCACTVGYGSAILGKHLPEAQIKGVDIEEKVIHFANDHHAGANVSFVASDAMQLDLPENSLDAIVSIETIEHVPDSAGLIAHFARWIRPRGVFVGSVPNEDVIPWATSGSVYHYRHFRPQEITDMLTEHGFELLEIFSQARDKQDRRSFIEGTDGWNLIFVARRI